MISTMTILGEHPFARNSEGKLVSRIGTVFPHSRTLVTLPGIHAMQRREYLDYLNRKCELEGREFMSADQEHLEWNGAVDLIFEDRAILIRPDPDNMRLAFEADEFLQEIVPKQRINFLGVLNEKVRTAIKKRGDWWRITPLPKSADDMKQMIRDSRIKLDNDEIYYYSKTTGVRYLTCGDFDELGKLGDESLRDHLIEIQKSSATVNAHGYPEIAFFAADRSMTKAAFAGHDFGKMDTHSLRNVFETLNGRFRDAVEPELRDDDPERAEWRNGMIAALFGEENETVPEETLLGLSPEFFMQIEWLPGGCIEEGELVLDFCMEKPRDEDGKEIQKLADERPQKFIFNFVREYGNLEYVNIGRVIGSLSRRPAFYGRRGVYVAVLKLQGSAREIVSIIRLQKYGVREYLEEGRPLLDAMLRSEEYTEYVLDRRLGCRQLGMNLPHRVTAKKINERYVAGDGHEFSIWTPYFERDYIRGIATDKVPPCRFENDEFALQFAHLLGRAAAPNIIVGRFDLGGHPLFDDGDEVLVEGARRMPGDIVVADHTGTFNNYLSPMADFASEYAGPINRRAEYLSNPRTFAEVYLRAFVERFSRIQDDYRKRKKAFDTLFKYRPRDEAGSFAYRWEKTLERLDATDPRELAKRIREHIEIPAPAGV